MNRTELWSQLPNAGVFDLAVIGGGATGLGVALDAALRGYRVVLLESHDFAGGTSSRSTKLLHGGVRYLAQGNISLVREALHERSSILRIAPHLAAPLSFVMPAYRWWEVPFYGIGLKVYDFLAGSAGLGATQWLTRKETQKLLPGVRADGLQGGVQYWDAQFDDARLSIALARSAQAAGGWIFNYAQVSQIQGPPMRGGKWTLHVRDATGQKTEPALIQAACVVNATGVWVDSVRSLEKGVGKIEPLVTPSQGVHLVVDRQFMRGENALLVPKTKDGRVLFAVPWLGSLILGTTDTPRTDAPREPMAFDEEVEFILREAGEVLSRSPKREDVRSVWVGLRPLVRADRETATRSISREHTIDISPKGLVTVTGGKWTTYRAMAEDVLCQIQQESLLPLRGKANTSSHILVGGSVESGKASALTKVPGSHLYGDRVNEVFSCPGGANELDFGLTEAMVRHAVRHEFACTVEDILARRWRVLFLDALKAKKIAPEVARIVQSETRRDPSLNAFLELCDGYVLH